MKQWLHRRGGILHVSTWEMSASEHICDVIHVPSPRQAHNYQSFLTQELHRQVTTSVRYLRDSQGQNQTQMCKEPFHMPSKKVKYCLVENGKDLKCCKFGISTTL